MRTCLFIALILTLPQTGCAGVPFPYNYYYTNHTDNLLGTKSADDLPAETCTVVNQGTPQVKHPCSVMLTPDLERFITDYLNTKQDLIDLQRRCNK